MSAVRFGEAPSSLVMLSCGLKELIEKLLLAKEDRFKLVSSVLL